MLFAEVAQTFERLSPDTNELPGLQQVYYTVISWLIGE